MEGAFSYVFCSIVVLEWLLLWFSYNHGHHSILLRPYVRLICWCRRRVRFCVRYFWFRRYIQRGEQPYPMRFLSKMIPPFSGKARSWFWRKYLGLSVHYMRRKWFYSFEKGDIRSGKIKRTNLTNAQKDVIIKTENSVSKENVLWNGLFWALSLAFAPLSEATALLLNNRQYKNRRSVGMRSAVFVFINHIFVAFLNIVTKIKYLLDNILFKCYNEANIKMNHRIQMILQF